MRLQLKGREKLSALVIEDEAEINELICDYLKETNLFSFVVSAKNGHEGYQRCRLQNFNLIITDLDMPRVRGEEFIENIDKIRIKDENRYDKPLFIIVSGNITIKSIQKLTKKRVGHVIVKPFRLENLDEILETLLSKNFPKVVGNQIRK